MIQAPKLSAIFEVAMKEDNLENKVKKIIKSISIFSESIQMETNLREELHFDSLTALMVMNEIDDVFDIEIIEEDFQNLVVVADIVRLLREKYLD
ncbi:MAG: acyl carrier protein [Desulfobulbales bacterium]